MSGKTENGVDVVEEINRLEGKVSEQIEKLYSNLDPWEKTQVARHPNRPHCMDYINALVEDFTPLAGDRLYSEDHAVVAGLGRWQGQRVAILGHEKGSDTQARLKHNFGMARPEGYRKAIRVMDTGRTFRSAGGHTGRYGRRLSRHRSGRTRPIGSDCAVHR